MKVDSYDLLFDIDFNELTFKGTDKIRIKAIGSIKLNCVDLTVKNVKKQGKNVKFRLNRDILIIPGTFDGIVEIEFSGKINDTLTGLYRAGYGNNYMLSSFLSSTNARKLFPCIDDPAYKATFKLAVRVDKALDCISNMPVKSVDAEKHKKTVKFIRTPKMSTYLLYIGIGKLDRISENVSGKKVSVIATEGKSRYGNFALDIARRSIDFFERFFGHVYPLPKLDLLSIPEFSVGGMENWGAITFRESSLIVSPKSTVITKLNAADTVAHEIAHQWFGDLVTTKDWSDIWLNESFATLMSYKFLSKEFAGWKPMYDFFELRFTSALLLDSLDSSHPVIIPVKTNEEANEVYDNISSYGKSVVVLRMIESFIGEKTFEYAVRSFVKKHKFANAVSDDLWSAFEAESKKPIKKIMHGFIERQGYPLLTVRKDKNGIIITQETFKLNGKKNNDVWYVPMTIRINGKKTVFMLKSKNSKLNLKDISSIEINDGNVGFYRTRYEGLEKEFWESGPSAFERWGFISDKFALLTAGRLRFEDYIKTVELFQNENENLPASEVLSELMLLWRINGALCKDATLKFINGQIGRVDKSDVDTDKILRGRLYVARSMLDWNFAHYLAQKFANFDNEDPNIKTAIAVAYSLTENNIDELKKRLEASTMDEERQYMIAALSMLKGENVEKVLKYVLSGQLRKQESAALIVTMALNKDAAPKMWDWLKLNHKIIYSIYKDSLMFSTILQRTLPLLWFCDSKEVSSFLKSNGYLKNNRAARIGLELLVIHKKLKERLG